MRVLLILLWTALYASPANAAPGLLDLNLLDPAALAGAVPQNVTDEAIKMFGIYTAHHPYTGATSIIHSNTFDLVLEASLVKIGPGLIDALNANGIPGTPPAAPAVPMAKLMLRKALSDRLDIGISGLGFRGQFILGGDLKIVLHHPEEGPSYALRLGYTYAKVPYAYVKTSSTISPEFVMSQPLYFAEPYLGFGARYIRGTLSVPFQGVAPFIPDFTVEKSGSGITGYAFTGVYFRLLGAQGLRLGIEGSFDLSGYHTLGGVFGLGF